MKRLTAIFMFILMMTTAMFAGTGITVVAQGRTVVVEVIDTNVYNIIALNRSERFTRSRLMTQNTGPLFFDVPEGQNTIIVMAVNMNTGEPERLEITLE